MIKAILFDCFGVLVGDTLLELLQQRVHDEKTWQEIWRRDDAVNRGEIAFDEYLSFIAGLVGLTHEQALAVFGRNAPNEQLFTYIRQLKSEYKLGVLSNMAHNMLEQLIGSEKQALFDAVTLSCDLGIVKPDRRMYLAAVNAVGCEPSECLFIDDKERYCEPAKQFGMQVIVYRHFVQFKNDCEVVLSQR